MGSASRWVLTVAVLAGLVLVAWSEGVRLYAWTVRRAANRAYYDGEFDTALARFETVRRLLSGYSTSHTDPADSICEVLEWSPERYADTEAYDAAAARAAEYYLDAIRVSPPNAWAYAGLGSLAGILGKARRGRNPVDLAGFHLKPLEALTPEDRLQEAALVRAVRIEPRNFYYRDFLAQFYWSRGFLELARAHVRQSVRLQPALHRHFYLSRLVMVSADLLGAVEDGVRDALEAGDTEVAPDQIHRLLGEIYLRRGDMGKARESFAEAAELSIRPAVLYIQIGRTHTAEGNHEEALASFRKAAEVEPENFRAWMQVGLALSRLDRHDEAVQALRRARGVEPGHFQPAWLLASELERGGETEEAVRIMESLVSRHPGQREPYLRLIDIYWRDGDLRQAIRVARRLAERFPDEPVFREQLEQLEQVEAERAPLR